MHFGSIAHTATIPVGDYELIVSDSLNTWYSEVITFLDFTPDLVGSECVLTKFTFWAECDIAGIFYRTVAQGDEQYKNVIYLDVDAGKPEYIYSEEGEEDAFGNFTAELRRTEKQYLLQPILPEFMLDAITLLPHYIPDNGYTKVVEVLTADGYEAEVDRITITPKWQGSLGVLGLTDIVFSTEYQTVTGCCSTTDSISTRCLRGGTDFVAKIANLTTDYNNFQYTDATDDLTKVDLVDGDRVLITYKSGGGTLAFRQYNDAGLSYDIISETLVKGQVFVDANQDAAEAGTIYYFYSGSGITSSPVITSEVYNGVLDMHVVRGAVWAGTSVKLYAILDDDSVEYIGQQDGDLFNLNGFNYDRPANAVQVYITCSGLNCDLGSSDVYDLVPAEITTGIGVMAVEEVTFVGQPIFTIG